MKYHETNVKHYVFTQLPELNEDGKRVLIDIIKPFDVLVSKIITLPEQLEKYQATAPALQGINTQADSEKEAIEKLGHKICEWFHRLYKVRTYELSYNFLNEYFSLTIEQK